MTILTKLINFQKLGLLLFAVRGQSVVAWVDHYDEGEDDAKVVRVFLPLIACAILMCIGGCYFKNHCTEQDEDKDKDTEGEQA